MAHGTVLQYHCTVGTSRLIDSCRSLRIVILTGTALFSSLLVVFIAASTRLMLKCWLLLPFGIHHPEDHEDAARHMSPKA
jgi:hypothetical protein